MQQLNTYLKKPNGNSSMLVKQIHALTLREYKIRKHEEQTAWDKIVTCNEKTENPACGNKKLDIL